MKTDDKFGISVKQYCKHHEAYIHKELEKHGASQKLLELHLRKLRWLQHERLVHLIVLFMTLVGDLFAIDLALLRQEANPFAWILAAIVTVLLCFYFAHYFFLENTTQHWYIIADKVAGSMKEKDTGKVLRDKTVVNR